MTPQQYETARIIYPQLPIECNDMAMLVQSYLGASIYKAIASDRVTIENGRVYFRITDEHRRYEEWKTTADRIASEMHALGYGAAINANSSTGNSIFFYLSLEL